MSDIRSDVEVMNTSVQALASGIGNAEIAVAAVETGDISLRSDGVGRALTRASKPDIEIAERIGGLTPIAWRSISPSNAMKRNMPWPVGSSIMRPGLGIWYIGDSLQVNEGDAPLSAPQKSMASIINMS